MPCVPQCAARQCLGSNHTGQPACACALAQRLRGVVREAYLAGMHVMCVSSSVVCRLACRRTPIVWRFAATEPCRRRVLRARDRNEVIAYVVCHMILYTHNVISGGKTSSESVARVPSRSRHAAPTNRKFSSSMTSQPKASNLW